MTGDVPQHGELDDHHIVPESWGKKRVPDGTINSILNRTPLTVETNRRVIKDRLPNVYLPDLIKQSGEATVRGILESHFISPVAFDILLRNPFSPADFETFIVERQRTLLDAIENLLIKERLDLSPPLRELDAAIEQTELKLRRLIEIVLDGDATGLPSHVLQKAEERIARALKKNAALDADKYQTLSGRLEYFDLRELQDTITSRALWARFESRFSTKEAFTAKLDQLAELRNGIRHSRAVGEIVRKEGEAAILFFNQILGDLPATRA
jgi:5'-deoxynucleotidase YfbR-like HD superfamily hydrolase